MSHKQTASIVELQQRIADRIAELGFTPRHPAETISRHLAEIAVLGRVFADDTLPLFLSINRDHTEAIAQLAVSIKCDLDELRDALSDVDNDLRTLMEFLNPHTRAQ